MNRLLLIFGFFSGLSTALAQSDRIGSAAIPMDETGSAPAIDVEPANHDDQNHHQWDPPHHYPDRASFEFDEPIPSTGGLVLLRVRPLHASSHRTVILNFSLDSHASLARAKLLQFLGYAIPTPQYLTKTWVTFPSIAVRDRFLDRLADSTLTSRGRWVVGGLGEIRNDRLTVPFQSVVLEPSTLTPPALHWGILTSAALENQRSSRALLVPLTLLDIPESVNLYSPEPARVLNQNLVFNRPFADAFQGKTSIGDVRWIAGKILALNSDQWRQIIEAGHYPSEISELLIRKTRARVNRLAELLRLPKPFSKEEIETDFTEGSVKAGIVTQKKFEGYAARFSDGDPFGPLRTSELLRFIGIEGLSSGLQSGLGKLSDFLQRWTPNHYIEKNKEEVLKKLADFVQKNPGQAYSQPISAFGGPTGGLNLNANRNLITGTYYGSDSQVQLVDTASIGFHLGGFLGTSGLKNIGPSASASVQLLRTYVHVKPIPDIRTATRESWKNLLVPSLMSDLAKILVETDDQPANQSIQDFMNRLKPGELFIINDSLASSAAVNFSIPVGSLVGLPPGLLNVSESFGASGSWVHLARTTLYRDQDGIHVYVNRIQSRAFELIGDTYFFIRLLTMGTQRYRGDATTQAYLIPEKLTHPQSQSGFIRSLRAILRRGNTDVIEEEFLPYQLDHEAKGHRNRFALGAWSWLKRETLHQLRIQPPADPIHQVVPQDHERTIIEGTLSKVRGRDPYGAFGRLIRSIIPFLNLGGGARGDDPSGNFLGRSNILKVNSQMEVTAGRPSKWIVTLSRDLRGWNLRRRQMDRAIRQIESSVNPDKKTRSLVQADEFSKMKRIQAYSILYRVGIDETGIHRIFQWLNTRVRGTQETQNFLVNLMGFDRYQKWCREHNPSADSPYQRTESIEGVRTSLECVTPWMNTIYDFRQKHGGTADLFDHTKRSEALAKKRIQILIRLLGHLDGDMTLEELLRWAGEDQTFFQARVSGFRAQDETGDSEYFSSTIGDEDSQGINGPLGDIQDTSGIIMNELQARYLYGGF